jgi:hypothetical protein
MTVTVAEIAALLTAIPALLTALATAYVQVKAHAEVAEVKADTALATAKVEVVELEAAAAYDGVASVARAAAGAEVSEALAARAATAVLVVSRDPANGIALLLREKGWPVVSAISPDDAGAAAALMTADLSVFDSLAEAEGLRLLEHTDSVVALTPPRTFYVDPAWGPKATLANMISTVAGHVLARALDGQAARRIMRLYRPPVAVEGADPATVGLTPATPSAVAEAKAQAQATLTADVEARISAIIAETKAARGRPGGADLLPGDYPAPSTPVKAMLLDV